MASQTRKPKLNNIENTGFSTSTQNIEGGRLTNKDGSINVQKTGIAFWERISLYHSLLRMRRWKFLLSVFTFYTVTNILFAIIYLLVGIKHLQGLHADNDLMSNFQQAFFFSSQTLTTVGYGHISPVGLWANIVASLESFVGILSFALVTGLLYGRFTRPRAYLKFSDNLLIAPHKGKTAAMVRVASYKNNHLTDVEAQVTISMFMTENGQHMRKFFTLPLEISRINSLALSWTMVHPIDEESPLYGMNHEDIAESKMEIRYNLKGFDDHFSNIVQQGTSYHYSEFVYGAKFQPVFHRSEDNTTTLLELDKLNAYEAITLPEIEKSAVNA
ncbi:MAG: Inward rectifier potassium channel Irk [Sphingobacteriales bacterium]|nr:MAG: Inward rectifier potassium channel Irk [Sphingobacteriales bacterium]